jgi:phosphoglycolate phosphatase-like HAD superfamily hydrolase
MHDKTLVLFDIDGTLLNSGGCGRAATGLAMQEVFDTIGLLDSISFAGKTDWQILLEALEPAGVPREEVQGRLEVYNTTVARVISEIIADFPLKPCPGAPEIVAALRTSPAALVGLVTGNMVGIVTPKLRAAGFDPADFKVGAFGSEGWERSMLPPLALRRAREYSGNNFAPRQVVIIGDTPGDVSCAQSIKARTVAVATGPFNVDQLRACQPDHVFKNMADTDSFLAALYQND